MLEVSATESCRCRDTNIWSLFRSQRRNPHRPPAVAIPRLFPNLSGCGNKESAQRGGEVGGFGFFVRSGDGLERGRLRRLSSR